jgi:hypothetical protein
MRLRGLAAGFACAAGALAAPAAARADAGSAWNTTASNAIDQQRYQLDLVAPRADPWDSKGAAVGSAAYVVSDFVAELGSLLTTRERA